MSDPKLTEEHVRASLWIASWRLNRFIHFGGIGILVAWAAWMVVLALLFFPLSKSVENMRSPLGVLTSWAAITLLAACLFSSIFVRRESNAIRKASDALSHSDLQLAKDLLKKSLLAPKEEFDE